MPDFTNDNRSAQEFEDAVRHVARQLYRNASLTGSIKLDGRERDEIIDTGTELIVIEATQSRKLDKVECDLKKSIELVNELKKKERFSDYNFRILLVTANDPTADQSGYVKTKRGGCPKEIISFTNLFSRLFDARHYIRLRADHFFGSVRDPANESNFEVPASAYIPTALSQENSGDVLKAAQLSDRITQGGHFVIYGDYGSGKSMTLRDLYFRAKDEFVSGRSIRCPIYVNLREHIAQTQPDEALYRHAEKIGFPSAHSLIAAWRSGFVTLFLDGFDELTPPQFASSVTNLRQARRFAVELVKRFIEQTPSGSPIILAGRESYFDGREEAETALGYAKSGQVFDLAGFTDGDIRKFLKSKGSNIPTWLPTRPLLLGYLANAGLLDEGDDLANLNPALGWDQVLRRVCEREVQQIWGVGFEASDLRIFIESLATFARKSRSARGIEDSDIRAVFRSVFGRDADEPANLLASRLPGLASVPGRPGAREFIDGDFAEAAAGGDFRRFIEAPYDANSPLSGVVVALGNLGRDLAVASLGNAGPKICIALGKAGERPEMSTAATDLIVTLIDRQESYEDPNVSIEDSDFDEVIVDAEVNLSSVTFRRCIINRVEFVRASTGQDARNFSKFIDCAIDRVEGALSLKDIPSSVFSGSTSVETFAAYTATNVAVMKSGLADPVKVLITILRKLFLQRGTGRRYSALTRGLPPTLVGLVEPIVQLVEAAGYAQTVYLDRRAVVIPNRMKTANALAIVNGPNASSDVLLDQVKGLRI